MDGIGYTTLVCLVLPKRRYNRHGDHHNTK